MFHLLVADSFLGGSGSYTSLQLVPVLNEATEDTRGGLSGSLVGSEIKLSLFLFCFCNDGAAVQVFHTESVHID